MELKAIKEMLKNTGYSVAYRFYKSKPEIPYIVYFAEDRNIAADGKVYHKFKRITVELYTEIKDTVAESKVEEILDNKEIFYEKEENYIDEEEMYQIIYQFEI